MQLKQGTVTALLGQAGSGKTAILLAIAGRLRVIPLAPCTVAGFDLLKQKKKIRQIAALSIFKNVNDPQTDLRVGSILGAEMRLVGMRAGHKRVIEYLQAWHFEEQAETKFSALSPFDQVRFGILLGLVSEPKILVVDDIQTEHTQYESIKLVEELSAIAQKTGCTIIFACNEYEIARHADGVVILSKEANEQRHAVIRDAQGAKGCKIVGIGNSAEDCIMRMSDAQASAKERVASNATAAAAPGAETTSDTAEAGGLDVSAEEDAWTTRAARGEGDGSAKEEGAQQ